MRKMDSSPIFWIWSCFDVEAELFEMEQGFFLAWDENFRFIMPECDCLEAVQIIRESLMVRYHRISEVTLWRILALFRARDSRYGYVLLLACLIS
ncbi:hypothetical protein Lal_00039786 [Lupinus albus]|nr:hypothetical protein Lal_00039786 [Lupinus albus]